MSAFEDALAFLPYRQRIKQLEADLAQARETRDAAQAEASRCAMAKQAAEAERDTLRRELAVAVRVNESLRLEAQEARQWP